jgi:EAL domain-containing protein (putative c-di-GMP-specific phosphodiesterase class I)
MSAAQATGKLRAKAALRQALERDELHVAYQPIIDLTTGAVVAAEALARWRDAQRGDIPPYEFIPWAEEAGLISDLGESVLRRVCCDLPRIRQASPSSFTHVSVNLSARQLSEPGLAERLHGILSQAGIDPHSVMFEVTETALTTNTVAAEKALRELRERGARIAVDDFGTGYSSLLSLKQFPVDVVKVDRSFVAGRTKTPTTR